MSMENAQGGGFQQQVLRRFTALMLLRESWAGALVLGLGLDEAGASLALAANIAGAVCLSVEPDVALLKAAQRSGACDFAVNTLDEALRTMKNEVRRGRALSVGLLGGPKTVLAEVVERGLLPELAIGKETASLEVVRAMGTKTISFTEADAMANVWASDRSLQLSSIAATSLVDVAALDADLKRLAEGDRLRALWLERVPQHFRRERPLSRAIWLTEPESHQTGRPAHSSWRSLTAVAPKEP